MGRIAALSLCVAVILAGAGAPRAEGAFDLVFRTGTLDALPQGAELRYEGEMTSGARPDEDWREVVVGLGPDDRAQVEGRADPGQGPARPIGSFDARVGNPVAMVFLERTVGTVAGATGGSPFYIRNRIRDALAGEGRVEAVTVDWGGETVPATAVVLRPFAGDARRSELGAFAGLEIRVVVSDAVPGWYHSISAEAPATPTGGAYAASLTLAGVER